MGHDRSPLPLRDLERPRGDRIGQGLPSGPEPYPATNTFSFRNATLTSPYLTFKSIEQYTNIPNTGGQGYTILQNPTKAEQTIIAKYSSPTYIPGATAGSTAFPFVDINNRVLISGASFSPGDPGRAVARADRQRPVRSEQPGDPGHRGHANYISAGICAATNNQPAAVCQSPGVQAATKALKLG